MDWLGALASLRQEGRPGVLVTVAEVRGHAPRAPGAKMVVGLEQTWGSVGGGNLEETAVRRARELITGHVRTAEMLESRLSPHAAHEHGRQCCGGEVRLLLEPFPVRPTVAIFGVGHVGFELARILSRLEIRLHLVDSRSEQLDELRLAEVTAGTADVQVHRAVLGELVLERLPAGAHVLIMTHDHAEDFALCDATLRLSIADLSAPQRAIARPDADKSGERWGSLGLIGSSAKWARFRRNLLAEGHDEAAVDRISCPIGRPEIVGKEPAVIAVSVAADLLRSLLPTLVGSAR
jgi:xanthine dehydrogenase accessory factor